MSEIRFISMVTVTQLLVNLFHFIQLEVKRGVTTLFTDTATSATVGTAMEANQIKKFCAESK